MFQPLQRRNFLDAVLWLAFAVLLAGSIPEAAAQKITLKSYPLSFKSHQIGFKAYNLGFKSYEFRLPIVDIAARVEEPKTPPEIPCR